MSLKRTVGEIVDEFILQKDYHRNQRVKLISYAMAFVRELIMYNDGDMSVPTSSKELFVVIPANRIIPFPDDYVYYNKIYTQIGTVKKPLSENTVESSFPQVPPVPANFDPFFRYGLEWRGEIVNWGGSFNEPKDLSYGNARNYGEFVVNHAQRRFEITPQFVERYGKSIIIDYVSNCIEQSQDLCLLPQWQTPLTTYLLWKDSFFRKDMAVAREYERVFNDEMVKARQTITLKLEDISRLVDQTLGYRYT